MKTGIVRALRSARIRVRDESGVSIIEVLAATLIFLILSVGVAQATVTAIRLSGDQRHRVTALSLAAGEIDLVRSIGDPFDIIDRDVTQTIDGVDYTIHRDTSWVSSTGLDIPCGAGGTGNLQYMRVNVRVTWVGQIEPISPVSSDTIIAPDGRLNDPARGTINVLVVGADGTGRAEVAVDIQPDGSDAESLDEQPDVTNAEGCTFATQVVPGSYTVELAKSGYISSEQDSAPTVTVEVAAGATVNASFTYDSAATFALSYVSAPVASVGSLVSAGDGEVTFINTYGAYYVRSSATASLFPWSSGYRAIAGHYVAPDATGAGGCPMVDPAEWAANPSSSPTLAAGTASAAAPSGSITVPMGVLEVKNIQRNYYLRAVSVSTPAVAGEPGCDETMGYTFTRTQNSSASETRTILLPYGTWKLYYTTSTSTGGSSGTGTTGWSSLSASQLTPKSNTLTSGMVSGNQVILDPRAAG